MIKSLFILFVFISCIDTGSVESMIGTDENKNGIRDDVDEFIKENSRNNDERRAFEQYAYYLTKTFETFKNKEESIQNSYMISKSGDCIDNVFLGQNKKYERKLLNEEGRYYRRIKDEIHSEIFDSYFRLKAYAKSNAHFSGEVTTGYKRAEDSCEFKLEGDYK